METAPSQRIKLSTRIYLVVIAAFLMLSVYFSWSTYSEKLATKEADNLSQLMNIAKTLSLSINGNDYQKLLEKHKNQDDIQASEQDSLYNEIHQKLKLAKEINNINTPIYTLTYVKKGSIFVFGVTSSENPYFRHLYNSYPEILLEKYNQGGKIPQYKDQNGTWLSAFYPIKNDDGKTLGVIQVDRFFTDFQTEAKKILITDATISFVILFIVSIALFPIIKNIVSQEEESFSRLTKKKQKIDFLLKESDEKNKELEESQQELMATEEQLNEEKRKVMSSIRYAQRLQEAILAKEEEIKKHFEDIFIFNKPKDIVSGDFYWFHHIAASKNENEKLIIAAVDCTGHGVPGAFISLIANNLLNHIVKNKKITAPNVILNQLRLWINSELKQQKTGLRDGMDLSICVIDKKEKTLHFAGAMNPLVFIKKDAVNQPKLVKIKGDKIHIGGFFKENTTSRYTNHSVDFSESTTFYIFSDGFQDQFGGQKDRKFMIRRFKELLLEIHEKPMQEQQQILNTRLSDWMGKNTQVDDILVIGFRF